MHSDAHYEEMQNPNNYEAYEADQDEVEEDEQDAIKPAVILYGITTETPFNQAMFILASMTKYSASDSTPVGKLVGQTLTVYGAILNHVDATVGADGKLNEAFDNIIFKYEDPENKGKFLFCRSSASNINKLFREGLIAYMGAYDWVVNGEPVGVRIKIKPGAGRTLAAEIVGNTIEQK